MQNTNDRRIAKLSYWQFVRESGVKIYPDGTRERRAIYLCTLCNREFDRSMRTDKANRNQCCVSCSRRRTNRKTWILLNLDTKKTIKVVNLKLWCQAHGVDKTSLYKTRTVKNRNFARDKRGNRWTVRDTFKGI